MALFDRAEERTRDLFSFNISHFTTEPQSVSTKDLAGSLSMNFEKLVDLKNDWFGNFLWISDSIILYSKKHYRLVMYGKLTDSVIS